MTEKLTIAFIKARWHAGIVDQALLGFIEEMKAAGRDAHVVTYDVPGAFEMPLLAQKLAATGKFDAIVAAALVVDGGIYRHDFVAAAVVNGLMEAQMKTGVPVFSVSLTPHHFQPTNEHVNFFAQHFLTKGAEAAQAVLAVVGIDVDAPLAMGSTAAPAPPEPKTKGK
ncbi:6,7-dimethyl-8-ribityllumazine synthase [Pseudorhodobacter sp.]|jgi:6,7-dimethyl-8-ribityllumazine synthase|uniref:6,7-dimethyl-8-ribityllumazine synthase n=1 Tax=Pseudorhodobacter sp. TaxID=1934400 RepID=UPI002AFFF8E1|nr:6,7-dimethyl-8-ribityllumazine synthase [Pseudorhodobacter sp.]